MVGFDVYALAFFAIVGSVVGSGMAASLRRGSTGVKRRARRPCEKDGSVKLRPPAAVVGRGYGETTEMEGNKRAEQRQSFRSKAAEDCAAC